MTDDLVKLGAEVRRRAMAYEHITTAESFIPLMADRIEAQAAEIERLRAALHCISLGSQDSGTTKEQLGREARAALEDKQ